MATYRRPGIEIIQQFQAAAPALALPSLPACIVGPGYQIKDDVSVGNYNDDSGAVITPSLFPYLGLAGGGIVDLADLDAGELASIQKPVGVKLKDVYLVEIDQITAADGVSIAGSTTFNDPAPAGIFSALNPGAVGAPLFYLQIVSGTFITAADKALNLIVAKTDDNTLKLSREISVGAVDIAYRVLSFSSSITYDGADFAALGIGKTAADVSLPGNLESSVDLGKKVAIASVLLSWRALRPDLAGNINVFTTLDDLEAVFGVGQVVPANILAFGILTALDNTTTEVSATGLSATLLTDEDEAYIDALDFLSDKDVYAIAVTSQNPLVHQTLSSHVTGESASTVGRERIGFINRKIKTVAVVTPSSGVGTASPGVTSGATNKTFRDDITTPATFITDGVQVGHFVEIKGYVANPLLLDPVTVSPGDTLTVVGINGTFAFAAAVPVLSAIAGNSLKVTGSVGGNNGIFLITSATLNTIVVKNPGGLSDETFSGAEIIETHDPIPTVAQDEFILGTRHFVNSVDSQVQLTLENDPTNGFVGTLTGVVYVITRDLTLDQQASFLAGYSSSFANRRLVNVWPDQLVRPVGGTATVLPGYFGGCALVGFVAGLPSQQGFTNLAITGFTGRIHGKDYFRDRQLDIIAGGGTLLLEQEVSDAPLFVRHQLTTDLSTIKFQELSVTKNVDLISRFFRDLNKKYIGIFNVNQPLIDHLRTVNTSGIEFLKASKAPNVGGVINSAAIIKLQPSDSQDDEVDLEIELGIPIPFNHLKITLLI